MKIDDLKNPDSVDAMHKVGISSLEEMKKAAGISAMDEIKQAAGYISPAMELMERAAVPYGITGMVQELERVRKESPFRYPELQTFPRDIPVLQPLSNPIHQVANILEKTQRNQEEMAGHVKELVAEAKGTSQQNARMIKISTASLLISALSIVVGIVCYQLGKSSTIQNQQPVPTLKATPAAIVKPALPVPTSLGSLK